MELIFTFSITSVLRPSGRHRRQRKQWSSVVVIIMYWFVIVDKRELKFQI